MKQLKQIGIILVLFISVLFFTSCLDSFQNDPRTQEMEQQELNQYIKNLISAGFNVDTTELGVYYVIKTAGEGVFPKQGDTLTVGYAGYFLDGSLFDSSTLNNSEGSITFNFLENRKISGFEDGLKLMNKGTQMEMIIPSSLAYGASGTLYIPAYATLIFVTEMKDLRPMVVSE